jgi:dienelactone hydrolase
MSQNLLKPDSLADFAVRSITLQNETRRVYVAGCGPAVLVMSEMPGISPHVARFARWLSEAGLKVYMPSIFGIDGAVPDAVDGAAVFQRACISAEFRALGGGASSPISSWLRVLARLAHEECGGAGVGAIGMCFTGNFALSMMLEPAVIAPVLSQPSLPLDNPGGLEISADELLAVAKRLRNENLTVLAYRFEGDPFCRAERFAAYSKALGKQFVPRVLPDSCANPGPRPPFFEHYVPRPHSVVTVDLVDRVGEPTAAARQEIIAFFRERLRTQS